MAAGDSITSICNAALIALGQDLVTSVNPPDNTKRAILCNARFDQVRRAVLRAHPWNCAMRQAGLAAAPAPPPFTYANAYPLPADFLRMFNLPQNDQAVWEVMNLKGIGPCVVTDEGAPLNTVYIFDLQDPSQMDALLVDAIAFALAAELALPLAQSKTLKQQMDAALAEKLAAARLVTSQEDSPVEWDEDVWLRRRR